MNSYQKFSIALYFLVCSFVYNNNCNAAPLNNDIDDIANDILSKIIQIDGTTATLNIKETSFHTSTPDGQIILSRSELNKLYTSSSKENFKAFLSIIIAHEYAHQLQFSEHKSEMIQTSSCEMKTFYEAEADIIAGYLFCRLYKYYETESIVSNNSDIMKSALGFMYNLGDAEYSVRTHPSFKQRRNSFRMGVAFAMYTYCLDVNTKNKIGNAYNINSSSDWSIWSEKMAKAVCHSPSYVILNILIEDIGDIEWHKTRDNPTVKFAQKYTNLSQEEVHLFLQYKVMGENRTDPDPEYTDITGDIKYFEFDLAPGKSYTCNGILSWENVANAKYLPVFVTPPDNEDLYFGTAINGENRYSENCFSITPNSAGKKFDFSVLISKINRESVTNFQSLILGFITGITDEFTTHQSKFIFPQSKSNEISIYKKDGSFNYDIGFSGSELEMQTLYTSLKNCLLNLNNLKLNDDFSVYIDEDGVRTNYDKNYNVSVKDQFELIKKNDTEERYSVKGVFKDSDCKIELELVKNLKRAEYEVNLYFIKSVNK